MWLFDHRYILWHNVTRSTKGYLTYTYYGTVYCTILCYLSCCANECKGNNSIKKRMIFLVAMTEVFFFFRLYILLPPTNEVWVGQGHVFTCVCHSVHTGVSVGGMVSVWGDHPDRDPIPTVKSGRSASYWNAFLFFSYFVKTGCW